MISPKRRIVYLSGTRADYGLMRSTLRAIHQHPRLQLSLIVTGTHLLRRFGHTIDVIRKDRFPICATIRIPDKTTPRDTTHSFSILVERVAGALQELRADILLLEADRYEALSAAVASAYLNIPIAHVSGGDVSGSIDDAARRAITSLAHIHFPGTRISAERIKRMGEENWRIHMVGTVGADQPVPPVSRGRRVAARLRLDPHKPIILVSEHPVPAEARCAHAQMEATMRAIVELKQQTVIFYPNQDAGADDIINVIKRYRRFPFIRVVKSLPRDDFLALMRVAAVIVGNSSAGIVEAPALKLPAVNIGTREWGRERGANVIDVPHDVSAIKQAIQNASSSAFRRKLAHARNPYRGRKTPLLIARVLASIPLDDRLIQKRMTY